MYMKQQESDHKSNLVRLISLIVFGTAFGLVEAAVVCYLRQLMNFHTNYVFTDYHVLLNLGFITFISSTHSLLISNHITMIETSREAATIIMLISVAIIAGKNRKQRIGAFLISFACWDISYYVFLKIFVNWPASLMTKDVYFLIPVTWIGPVITPLIISTALLIIGAKLYLHPESKIPAKWNELKFVYVKKLQVTCTSYLCILQCRYVERCN